MKTTTGSREALREMAGTVAVKGPLLIELLDDIDSMRADYALLVAEHEKTEAELATMTWAYLRVERALMSLTDGFKYSTEVVTIARQALGVEITRTSAEGAPKPDDPNAPYRWICIHCTTANGIYDRVCLGCRKPKGDSDGG